MHRPLESDLTPYSASLCIPAQAVLVLAPHPDDEVFGCGGAIAAHVQAAIPVKVVVLSDGARFGDASVRSRECIAAAKVLGYGVPEFWELPDRGVRYSEDLVLRIAASMDSVGADLVYCPSPWEVHPDHRQATMLAVEAVQRATRPVRLAFYEVGAPLRPNVLLDISDQAATKDAAMQCFASQMDQQDYLRHVHGLNQFRTYTLPRQIKAAEAFWVVSAAEVGRQMPSDWLNTTSPGLLGDGAALPQGLPLVSILIRSAGGVHLAEALDSVALQTYRPIEVIVVAMRPGHDPLPAMHGGFPLRLLTTGKVLSPSLAANLAMEHARGELLLFLDEDDWLMPGHVARLAHVLTLQPHALAAYTGISLVSTEGDSLGQVFDVPFDAIRQLAGNLAPIHAVLFRAKAMNLGCKFDEALTSCDDWDFWLQLGRLAPLVHLPGVSGAYRSREGHAETTDSTKNWTGAREIQGKWAKLWTAQQIDQMMHRVWTHPQLESRLEGAQQQLNSAQVLVDQGQQLLAQQQQQNQTLSETLASQQRQNQTLSETLASQQRQNQILNETLALQQQQLELEQRQCQALAESLSQQQRQLAAEQEQGRALAERLVQQHEQLESAQQHSQALVESLAQKTQYGEQLQRLNQELELSRAWFAQQTDALLQSSSWKITAPIRWIGQIVPFTRGVLHTNWLARSTYQALLRSIYMRSGLLRAGRQKYLQWKLRAASNIQVIANSKDNSLALQALSNRRFAQDALVSATSAANPVTLPEIDISAVSYNSARWIKPFFDSLLALDYPPSKIHLHFVDHGSKDDTVSQLREMLTTTAARFASSRVIEQSNLGFGAGHDRAIQEGHAPYCLVTNLDLEFSPDALRQAVLVALSDTHESVASWEFSQAPYEHPKYYDPVTLETNWSSHACVLIRRSAYSRVGGYDKAIFMYAEDVELSYRLRSYGYALKYLPKARVLHHTYEDVGQVKSMQFAGSTIGNVYIRFRYGKSADRRAAVLLYAALLARPAPFPGAKRLLLKNAIGLLTKAPHFLVGKGNEQAYFPLRGFDYEMTRDGAFWNTQAVNDCGSFPLISIITRTYKGRGMFLEQAMQTVFNQTYPAIELLVIEDGGNSQQELALTLAKRAPSSVVVRFFANEKLGRSAAGNVGLAASKGQYLMFLDDDDLLLSDHVETLMATLLRDASLSAAYALSMEVLTAVEPSMERYVEESFYTPGLFRQEWDYSVLLDHNFIPIQAILFKRDLYALRGGFDMSLDQLEDWNLWLRYGYGNKFAYVAKTTSLFRSPAKPEVRSARHMLLHEAYNTAKSGAMRSLGLESASQ